MLKYFQSSSINTKHPLLFGSDIGEIQRWRRQNIHLNRAENIEILKRCLNSLNQVILAIKILIGKYPQNILKAIGLFCTEDIELYLLLLGNHISCTVILML